MSLEGVADASYCEYHPTFANQVLAHGEGLQSFKKIVSGGIAGCIGKTATAPLSRVTILMQVQSMRPRKYKHGAGPSNQYLLPSFQKIFVQEGFGAFWRGNGASMIHRFPYTGLNFYGNSFFKECLREWLGPGMLSDKVRTFLASGASAACACTMCYPLDVVKTRLSAQTKRRYYTGIVDAFRKIFRDEGLLGLYRGLRMSLISVVPAIAVNFTAFDLFLAKYKDLGFSSIFGEFLAGGSAGALASTMFFPVDLLKKQMQMVGFGGRTHIYGSVFDAVRQVYMTGYSKDSPTVVYLYSISSTVPWWLRHLLGFREFFRGLAPELLKVTPFAAIMFSVNHTLLSTRWPLEPAK